MDDPSSGEINKDSIFWICSQTKMITHACFSWKLLRPYYRLLIVTFFSVGRIAAHRKRETSSRYTCIHLPSRIRKSNHCRWYHGQKTILQICNKGGSGTALAELLQWHILSAYICTTKWVHGTTRPKRSSKTFLRHHQGQHYILWKKNFWLVCLYASSVYCRATCLPSPLNLSLVPTVSPPSPIMALLMFAHSLLVVYGYSSETLGFIIEKVTGQTLEEYL